MPTRRSRQRLHRHLAHIAGLGPGARRDLGTGHLARWRAEANRRADDLGAPAVWELEARYRPLALALDPSGELAGELSRVCAEAFARAAGRHLVGVSRPLADRARLRDRSGRSRS